MPSLRLGLCCQFAEAPIKFRTTTAAALSRLPEPDRAIRLAELAHSNASALHEAVTFCAQSEIGAFRVNSQILPLKTHPYLGYDLAELPNGAEIMNLYREVGLLARQLNVRLSFHPDQYVVLNSPQPTTVASSVRELKYQAEVAEWLGADTINLHGGGAYGDKASALLALRRAIETLPEPVRTRLTLENDDRVYTPSDLLPVCRELGVPLVYDVHHHRILPDGADVAETTELARATWSREPLFHISSPLEGWDGPKPHRHHDYVDVKDFPPEWLGWPLTVDVEAKAKELAVARLKADLGRLDAGVAVHQT